MTRRMLINARHAEEIRVAVIEDTRLESYQVERADSGLTRGNIYRGVISNIQPSLNAAFVDYGSERNGFLTVGDVVDEAFHRSSKSKERPKIEKVLEKGRPILVQVTKDPVGSKGAALTTNISLAGRYLVLTPFDDSKGISRKIEDDELRKSIKERMSSLKLPQGCGLIVRTNGLEQNKTTLNRDLAALLRLWRSIQKEAKAGKSPRLLYSDQDLIVEALRDYLDSSVAEVLVDDDHVHERAESYMRTFMPRAKTVLTRYAERLPLFTRFHLETQIDRIYERTVSLPSGGSISIDATEALTAIDVNSGRSLRASSQAETAYQTNLEAAEEVGRQLRLRDIGGLIVVDFIDMRQRKHERKVENTLRDAMKPDKARVSIGRISPNGLLEVNRQSLKKALQLRTRRPCPTCQGTGSVASPDVMSLNLLRRIEARAASERLRGVKIHLAPEIADAFQNGHRRELSALESEFDVRIEIYSSPMMSPSEQRVSWVEREGLPHPERPIILPFETPTLLSTAEAESASRRRRKDGRGDDDEALAPEDDDKEPRERRRRRRRRSRSGESAAGEAAAEATPAPKAEAKEEPSESEPKPRRSRRRRRGGSRAKDEAGSPPKEAESTERSAAGTEARPTPVEATEAKGEDGPKQPTRRRTRRSRRSSTARDSEAPAAPTVAAPEGDDKPAPADTAPKASKPPARRRSRRRSPETEAGASPEAPSPPAEAKSDKGDGEGSAPRVRRRRRSRSRATETPTDGG